MDKEKPTAHNSTATQARAVFDWDRLVQAEARELSAVPPPRRPAVPPSFVFERPQRRRQRWASFFARARRGGGSGRFLDFATHGNGFEYFFNRLVVRLDTGAPNQLSENWRPLFVRHQSDANKTRLSF